MQKVKPLQIVLFVAAVGAIAFTSYRLIRGDGIKMSDHLLVVDITSGELFEIDTNGKGIVLPAKNPSTGERTLYPMYRDDNGDLILEERGLARLEEHETTLNDHINRETGQVEADGKKIKRLNARDLVKR